MAGSIIKGTTSATILANNFGAFTAQVREVPPTPFVLTTWVWPNYEALTGAFIAVFCQRSAPQLGPGDTFTSISWAPDSAVDVVDLNVEGATVAASYPTWFRDYSAPLLCDYGETPWWLIALNGSAPASDTHTVINFQITLL